MFSSIFNLSDSCFLAFLPDMEKSGLVENAPREGKYLFEPDLKDLVEDSETSTP